MYRQLQKVIAGFVLGLALIVFSPLLSPLIVYNPKVTSVANETVNLIENLGNYHHPISTSSDLAQKYFDQGLTLTYGFNHAQAARLFEKAIALDPDCVMCHWGLAYTFGPNINAVMLDEQVSPAWRATQNAIAIIDKGSPKEQAYIKALAKRYSEKPLEDRSELDLAYAQAMQKVAQEYPDDLDAATLSAEALMDTMPWDYWQEDGELKPKGKVIVDTLEAVLAQNTQHPGANHLYIHALEKEKPQLAIKAADTLRDLVPASGHLDHMPSHIYIRVGRYQDAVIANLKAIEADNQYLSQPHPDSIYKYAYVPHNHHFLWFAALMSGQSQIAIQAAENTAKIEEKLIREPAFAGALQHFSVVPLYTKIRLGKWQSILDTSVPKADLKYPTGVWHYARGMAFVNQNNLDQARQELAQLKTFVEDPVLEEMKIFGLNSTASILNIASEVLAGSIANAQQDHDTAISHLRTAIKLENDLVYTEPPDWYSPTHNFLGNILLQSDRWAEAEAEFRQDLVIYPDNGWSLHGLAQSLKKQGKMAEAKTVKKQFEQAWQYADIAL